MAIGLKIKPFTLEVESDNLGYEFGVKVNIPEKKELNLKNSIVSLLTAASTALSLG